MREVLPPRTGRRRNVHRGLAAILWGPDPLTKVVGIAAVVGGLLWFIASAKDLDDCLNANGSPFDAIRQHTNGIRAECATLQSLVGA